MRDQALTAFEEGLRRSLRRLLGEGRHLILAVSGGADSMALLSGVTRLAPALQLGLDVVTVDHGLRPEAAEEVALVSRWCTAHGVRHHAVQVTVSPGSGLEAAARAARYEALQRASADLRAHAIATAHTADDQAETLLMRLMRGAVGGARGIHEQRDDGVIRPLLFATRAEVLAWVRAHEVPFVRDPMNDDPRFLRVRVRQEVLPLLDRVSGAPVARSLARHAAFVAEDEAWLVSHARDALASVEDGDGLRLDEARALPGPVLRRVLVSWLASRSVEVDAEVVLDALRVVRDGGRATLPGDRLLACKNGRAIVLPAPPRLHATSGATSGRKVP